MGDGLSFDLTVVGVDPGVHVGFAVLNFTVLDLANRSFQARELTREEAEDELVRLTKRRGGQTVIGMERYTLGSTRRTHQPDALELIGSARFIARRYGAEYLVQGASDAAKTGSADVLRALGWWQVGAPDHVHRACSQVALALSQILPVTFVQLKNPGTVQL